MVFIEKNLRKGICYKKQQVDRFASELTKEDERSFKELKNSADSNSLVFRRTKVRHKCCLVYLVDLANIKTVKNMELYHIINCFDFTITFIFQTQIQNK